MTDVPENRGGADKDLIHLLQITHELELAMRFLDGVSYERFEEDEWNQHAVSFAIAQAGEHIKKLSKAFVQSQPDVEWKAIAGTRDWIVHDYPNLDFETLYDSVTQQAPELVRYLHTVIAEFSQPSAVDTPKGRDILASAQEL